MLLLTPPTAQFLDSHVLEGEFTDNSSHLASLGLQPPCEAPCRDGNPEAGRQRHAQEPGCAVADLGDAEGLGVENHLQPIRPADQAGFHPQTGKCVFVQTCTLHELHPACDSCTVCASLIQAHP